MNTTTVESCGTSERPTSPVETFAFLSRVGTPPSPAMVSMLAQTVGGDHGFGVAWVESLDALKDPCGWMMVRRDRLGLLDAIRKEESLWPARALGFSAAAFVAVGYREESYGGAQPVTNAPPGAVAVLDERAGELGGGPLLADGDGALMPAGLTIAEEAAWEVRVGTGSLLDRLRAALAWCGPDAALVALWPGLGIMARAAPGKRLWACDRAEGSYLISVAPASPVVQSSPSTVVGPRESSRWRGVSVWGRAMPGGG